jgi:hypothetical protein
MILHDIMYSVRYSMKRAHADLIRDLARARVARKKRAIRYRKLDPDEFMAKTRVSSTSGGRDA